MWELLQAAAGREHNKRVMARLEPENKVPYGINPEHPRFRGPHKPTACFQQPTLCPSKSGAAKSLTRINNQVFHLLCEVHPQRFYINPTYWCERLRFFCYSRALPFCSRECEGNSKKHAQQKAHIALGSATEPSSALRRAEPLARCQRDFHSFLRCCCFRIMFVCRPVSGHQSFKNDTQSFIFLSFTGTRGYGNGHRLKKLKGRKSDENNQQLSKPWKQLINGSQSINSCFIYSIS